MEKMLSRMVWLMSSMFAPHSASAVATAATMPLRSLPKTETTHFMLVLSIFCKRACTDVLASYVRTYYLITNECFT